MCIKRSYGRDNHPFVIIFVCLFFSVLLCFVVVVIFFIVCFFPNVSVAFSHHPSLARERKCQGQRLGLGLSKTFAIY